MNTSELLVEAERAVEAANVSRDLRTVAFEKAFDVLCREAGLGGATPGGSREIHRGTHDGKAEGGLVAMARKLNVELDTLNELFAANDRGDIELVVGVGKLQSTTAAATKQIALLVSGARQLSGIEEWTASREIRAVCANYGRFDNANFAKTLRDMDNAFSFKGKAQQLEVRLHQRGIEALKALIATITGNQQ
jgi:hypothetical protein